MTEANETSAATADHATAESEDARVRRIASGVRVIREGHGANCSSIGSVVDTLFATAMVGGAVLAAVAAALAREDVRVVGEPPEPATKDAEPTRGEPSHEDEAPR